MRKALDGRLGVVFASDAKQSSSRACRRVCIAAALKRVVMTEEEKFASMQARLSVFAPARPKMKLLGTQVTQSGTNPV